MMRIREEKGFTLIELMVVVLIIAILVAIAIPIFNRARDSAWSSTCKANLRTIDGAIQTYGAANGNYTGVGATGVSTAVDEDNNLVPDFLKQAPACPKCVSEQPPDGTAGNYDSAPVPGGGAYSYYIAESGASTVAVNFTTFCDGYGPAGTGDADGTHVY